MCRHDLTDRAWERLEPLLPPQRPPKGSKGGTPFVDHRRVSNGLLWLDRTGAPWRDIPERYGPFSTLASRFYRWREPGLWQRILDALQEQADAAGLLDWESQYVDGTVIRAHQHAAGAAGSDAEREALGRSQGGFSTKLHVRAEGQGKPMTFVLTPGQRHETTAFEQLMEQGAGKRSGRGRPRLRPRRVVGDKGSSSRTIRQYLRRHGMRMTIPGAPWAKTTERRGRFDRAVYRLRTLVERLINRLKQFRRVATRYEKRGVNYHGMLLLAAIKFWL
jgi:transposase